MSAEVHLFGVRHHGPGSARAVLCAVLDAVRPGCVLIEGPPDADGVIECAVREEMRPPVAILVYQADDAKRAVFYPFAEFSPEWCAIRWAVANRVPVRFMDLPQTHRLAAESAPPPAEGRANDGRLAWFARSAGGRADSRRPVARAARSAQCAGQSGRLR